MLGHGLPAGEPELQALRKGLHSMWFCPSAMGLGSPRRPRPDVGSQDPAQGTPPACACSRAGALAAGRGGRSSPVRQTALAGRSQCLLSPQSPGLLASLGAGLLTLFGLALGSYLVRRSRRPWVTLRDPNEKYLLRLLDKTVSRGRRGGVEAGPELPSGREATASTVLGMSW